MRALSHVLVVAFAVIAVVYATSSTSGPAEAPTTACPSASVAMRRGIGCCARGAGRYGLSFGIAGLGLILVTLLYVLRKKVSWLSRIGNLKIWLEVHIFCGIVGPALITLHTSLGSSTA